MNIESVYMNSKLWHLSDNSLSKICISLSLLKSKVDDRGKVKIQVEREMKRKALC